MAYQFSMTAKTGLYTTQTGPEIFEKCFPVTTIFYPLLALPNICDTGPDMCDNKHYMVIVTHIWQKLSSVERDVTLIVKHFWQLFSRIFGETSLIVTHIWRNRFCFPYFDYIVYCRLRPLRQKSEKTWVQTILHHESGRWPFSKKYLWKEGANCLF